jgi:Tfp pilus assembly protein PilO
MTRVQILLAALGAVLLVVLFWLLLWSPQQEELENVRGQIEDAQARQSQLAAERDALRAVRDDAPGVEAELAAASAVVPSDPALPSALRQLQSAADEAGIVLQTVSPARPSQVDGADQGVSRINVNAQVSGTYFQLVDFLRRIEDPEITPRGIVWNSANLARDEYPTITATLTGSMYTRLPGPPPEPEVEEDDDEDADVEVEIEEDDE